jgi:DNA-binding NarL/FixJ family response regulator
MNSERIRVLLADDHPVYRDGLAGLLGATTDLTVVGQASTGRRAVTMAESLTPDVVVLDLNMPELNGVDAARQIVATAPHTAVLILTMYDDDALVFQAMQAGAGATCSSPRIPTPSWPPCAPWPAVRRSSAPLLRNDSRTGSARWTATAARSRR